MMKRLTLMTSICLCLAACGSDNKAANSKVAGDPEPLSHGDFKSFQMNLKSDCAGFRRSFTYLEGVAKTGHGPEVIVHLMLDEGGTYRARIRPGEVEEKTIEGRWSLSGAELNLNGLGMAAPGLAPGDAPLLMLRVTEGEAARLLSNSSIPFIRKVERNDSMMKKCSPTDNVRLSLSQRGEVLIDGEVALDFWSKLFQMGSEEWVARVGQAGGKEVRVKLNKDGSFHYSEKKPGHFFELKGAWIVNEGLLVLIDLGVLVPFSLAPDAQMIPYLYWSHDPQTRQKVTGAFKGLRLDYYSF